MRALQPEPVREFRATVTAVMAPPTAREPPGRYPTPWRGVPALFSWTNLNKHHWMTRWVIVVPLLLALPASHAAEELKTFLGLTLGAPMQEQKAVPVCKDSEEVQPAQYCRSADAVYGIVVLNNVVPEYGDWSGWVKLMEGRAEFVSIIVPKGQRNNALALLRTRYGGPHSSGPMVYRNRLDERVEGTGHVWHFKNASLGLQLDDRTGPTAHDEIRLMTRTWMLQFHTDVRSAAEEKLRAKAASRF